MRRIIAALTIAAAAVLAGATGVSAHHPLVTGEAICDAGNAKIRWTATWWNQSGVQVAGPETRTGGPVSLRTDCTPPTTSTTSTSTTSSTTLPPDTSTTTTAPPATSTSSPTTTADTTTTTDIGTPPEPSTSTVAAVAAVPPPTPPAVGPVLPETGARATLTIAATVTLVAGLALVAIRRRWSQS